MDYAEIYSAKSDEELQQLDREKDTLRPEAAVALATELARRGVPSEASAPERMTKVDVAPPYPSLIFALVCFTVSTACFVFSLTLATTFGNPDAFTQDGFSFLGLVLTAYWAQTSWSKIKLIEPESNPDFRSKHRAFGLKTGALMVAMVLAAGTYGSLLGVRKAEVKSLMDQMKSISANGRIAKQKFIEITDRDTPTMADYLQQCRELEPILNDYEPALQQMDNILVRLQETVGSNEANRNTVATLRPLIQKDLEAVQIYRREVSSAKQLAALPVAQQDQFYEEKIKPIKDAEHQIAEDEIQILKSAKTNGVKFPEDVYRQAGIK